MVVIGPCFRSNETPDKELKTINIVIKSVWVRVWLAEAWKSATWSLFHWWLLTPASRSTVTDTDSTTLAGRMSKFISQNIANYLHILVLQIQTLHFPVLATRSKSPEAQKWLLLCSSWEENATLVWRVDERRPASDVKQLRSGDLKGTAFQWKHVLEKRWKVTRAEGLTVDPVVKVGENRRLFRVQSRFETNVSEGDPGFDSNHIHTHTHATIQSSMLCEHTGSDVCQWLCKRSTQLALYSL